MKRIEKRCKFCEVSFISSWNHRDGRYQEFCSHKCGGKYRSITKRSNETDAQFSTRLTRHIRKRNGFAVNTETRFKPGRTAWNKGTGKTDSLNADKLIAEAYAREARKLRKFDELNHWSKLANSFLSIQQQRATGWSSAKKRYLKAKEEKSNLWWRMKLRSRIYNVLKGYTKSAPTLKLLGCSIEYLKQHLAERFLPGMTWDNYGLWHIDHIKPCARFNLADPAQQRLCFHFSNLQPLWATDNIRKSDNYHQP